MDSDPVKDVASLRQLSVGWKSEQLELDQDIADLEEQIKEVRMRKEAKRQQNAYLATQKEFKEKEIAMLKSNIECLENQNTMYTDVVRPQLLVELKQTKDLHKVKQQKYKDTIEKYEKTWKEYEVEYNKFPRVAERNALAEKVRLGKLELEQKKQKSVELRHKVEEKKAAEIQRLEALKQQYLELHAEEQQKKLKNHQLQQELEEIKARVDLKKAAHKQREKEAKLQEEVQKQMMEKAELATGNQGTSTVKSMSSIKLPVLKLPDLNWPTFKLSHPLQERRGFSQELKSLSSSAASGSYTEGSLFKSASQPKSLPHDWASSTSITTKPSFLGKKVSAQKAIPVSSGAIKKLQDPIVPELNAVENPSSMMEVNKVIPNSPFNSGCSKKESILSTDTIAAKLKETVRPNFTAAEFNVNEAQSPMTKSPKVLSLDKVAPSSQGDLFTEERNCQDTMEVMETDQENNVNIQPDSSKNMDQGKTFETTNMIENSPSLTLSDSAENDNPTEDDNCFDFNAAYGDEMYCSLQSPPTFECAMSPQHAGFESSPSKDSEEAQDAEQPAFGAFGFFSKSATAVTNMFGGQSSFKKSGTETDKNSSPFSFQF